MTSSLANIRVGDPLTDAELEVLRLAANGLGCMAIAARHHIAYQTAKSRLARIKRKLGARTLAHAVSLAIRSRQIHPREIEPTDAIRSMT